MARSTGQSVPKYRKHKATGQAVCTISGKDYYLGPHGTKASKIEYDRLIGEWLAGGRPTNLAAAEDLTIVELLASYLRYAKQYYGSDKYEKYQHCQRIAKPLKRLYGKTPVAEFGPLQFKTIREQYIANDCSRSYINHSMKWTARIFRWGAGEGLIPASLPQSLAMVDGLRRGKTEARETEPVKPIDDETVEATLPYMPQIPADMVRLQRRTAARPSEICRLRPCDLDRSAAEWIYRPDSHKTEHHGHERIVPIGPRGQQILLNYLVRGTDTFCFRPCDSEAKRLVAVHEARTTPIGYGNKPGTNRKRKPKRQPGKFYTTDSYRRAIHRACDKAFPHPELGSKVLSSLTDEQRDDLKRWQSEHRWSPNQLRHAAATEIRSKYGLEAAQVILGHSQANVTQVYAERDLAKGLEVARQIG
jgi:integrase